MAEKRGEYSRAVKRLMKEETEETSSKFDDVLVRFSGWIMFWVILLILVYWALSTPDSFLYFIPSILFIGFTCIVFVGILTYFIDKYKKTYGGAVRFSASDNAIMGLLFAGLFFFSNIFPIIIFLALYAVLSLLIFIIVYRLEFEKSAPIILFMIIAGWLLKYVSADLIIFLTRFLGALLGVNITVG